MTSAGKTIPDEEILEPDLAICDPHHHLWDFAASRYLLPELLADIGSGHRVESTVFVECTAFYRDGGPDHLRFVGETGFVAGIAAEASRGRVRACEAIVGRADLTLGAGVAEVLDAHVAAGGGRFRGVRHVGAWDASPDIRPSHTHPPRGLYQSASFRRGFAELASRGLGFEAWQYHTQLGEVAALADAFPATTIVLDHAGGPLGIGPYQGRRGEVFAAWAGGIHELARRSNVVVKLGGLGMAVCGFDFHKRPVLPGSAELADAWRPYLETCIEAFGPQRAMFESNFPVDKVSCSYASCWNAFKRVAAGASAADKALLFRDTARRVYRLDGRLDAA